MSHDAHKGLGYLVCVCLLGLTGCATSPSTDDVGGQVQAAEMPLPQRVVARRRESESAPSPDYRVIGERNIFQPRLLTRRQRAKGERQKAKGENEVTPSPLHPFTPSLPPLSAPGAPDVPPLTGWRVVGVLITDERQAAWLEDAQHQTVWVEVGSLLAGGQKVVGITPSGVRVQTAEGEEVVLGGQAESGHRVTSKVRGEARETPLEERVRGQP